MQFCILDGSLLECWNVLPRIFHCVQHRDYPKPGRGSTRFHLQRVQLVQARSVLRYAGTRNSDLQKR